MASFSLAGLITAPIFGKITDRLGKGKPSAIVGIIFGIGGNVVYFCSRTKWGITAARFISGVGFALDGSMIGTLSKSINSSQKSKLVGSMLLLRNDL